VQRPPERLLSAGNGRESRIGGPVVRDEARHRHRDRSYSLFLEAALESVARTGDRRDAEAVVAHVLELGTE